MAKMFEYLPKNHPFLITLKEDLFKKYKNNPLYLATSTYLKNSRYFITEDWAGDTSAEILKFLKPKFTSRELEDLAKGLIVESSDGKRQYKLSPKLPDKDLGNIQIPKTNTIIEPPEPPKIEEKEVNKEDELIKIRKQLNMSQKELSNAIIPGNSYIIASIEKGRRQFRKNELEAFYKFCKEKNITVTYNFSWVEENKCKSSIKPKLPPLTITQIELIKLRESLNMTQKELSNALKPGT
jgi:hypothetical protein